MSHEMLRQAAKKLQRDKNPAYRQGGRFVENAANILFAGGFIPEKDTTQTANLAEEIPENTYFTARDFDFESATGTIIKDGQPFSQLTPTEAKHLSFFLTHPGQVFTENGIHESLYGGNAIETYVTVVKTYLLRIRRKLPVDNETSMKIIENIRGYGYRYNHFPKEES